MNFFMLPMSTWGPTCEMIFPRVRMSTIRARIKSMVSKMDKPTLAVEVGEGTDAGRLRLRPTWDAARPYLRNLQPNIPDSQLEYVLCPCLSSSSSSSL